MENVCTGTLWFDYGAHPGPAVKALTEHYHSGVDRAKRLNLSTPPLVLFSSSSASAATTVSILQKGYCDASTSEFSICLAPFPGPDTFLRICFVESRIGISRDCTTTHPHLLGLDVFYLLPFYVSRGLAALVMLDLRPRLISPH